MHFWLLLNSRTSTWLGRSGTSARSSTTRRWDWTRTRQRRGRVPASRSLPAGSRWEESRRPWRPPRAVRRRNPPPYRCDITCLSLCCLPCPKFMYRNLLKYMKTYIIVINYTIHYANNRSPRNIQKQLFYIIIIYWLDIDISYRDVIIDFIINDPANQIKCQ